MPSVFWSIGVALVWVLALVLVLVLLLLLLLMMVLAVVGCSGVPLVPQSCYSRISPDSKALPAQPQSHSAGPVHEQIGSSMHRCVEPSGRSNTTGAGVQPRPSVS